MNTDNTSLKYSDLKGKKVAVHCSTQEEWDKVCKIIGIDNWKYLESGFDCISAPQAVGSKTEYIGYGYTIIPASDFIKANTVEAMTDNTRELPETCILPITTPCHHRYTCKQCTPFLVEANTPEVKEKLKLVVGNEYVLDKDFANHSIVKLLHIGEHGHYCKVRSEDSEWQTMCDRLSPLPTPEVELKKDLAIDYHCANAHTTDVAKIKLESKEEEVEPTQSNRLQEQLEELWDKHAEYMGTDIDSLQDFAGRTIMTRRHFDNLIADAVINKKL